MALTVRIPAVLHRYSGGAGEQRVEGATVREALDHLFAALPELRTRVLDENGAIHGHLRLFRNGEPADIDAALETGDTLEITAAAAGG